MAQNGDTVAGRKVQLIVKDDAGVPDATRRIAQELVVNDKVAVLAGFGLTPLGPGRPRPSPPRSKTPHGHDRGGHFGEHHRALALHRPHQLDPCRRRGCRRGRLGGQERHQEGRHLGRPTTALASTPRSSSRSRLTIQRRPDRRRASLAPAHPRLRALPAEGAPTSSPTRCSRSCLRGQGAAVHEAVRRARPLQGRHQADRHGRRDRRRQAQRHGRRCARRRQPRTTTRRRTRRRPTRSSCRCSRGRSRASRRRTR